MPTLQHTIDKYATLKHGHNKTRQMNLEMFEHAQMNTVTYYLMAIGYWEGKELGKRKVGSTWR